MHVKDLKKDSYYKFYGYQYHYYIRFEKIEKQTIYSYGWEIKLLIKRDCETVLENKAYYGLNNVFGNIINNEENLNVEEVELSEIIDYLPNNHPDKIIYRNKRIKMILNV